jgi:hypothetical protein
MPEQAPAEEKPDTVAPRWGDEASVTPQWVARLQPGGGAAEGWHWHYQAIAVHDLRALYLNLQDDFRAIIHARPRSPNFDERAAAHVSERLRCARQILERETIPEWQAEGEAARFTVSALLMAAERGMVRLYPPQMALARWYELHRKATQLGHDGLPLVQALQALRDGRAGDVSDVGHRMAAVYDAVEDARSDYARHSIASSAIQGRRLKGVRRAGFYALALTFLAAPLILPAQPVADGAELLRLPYVSPSLPWGARVGPHTFNAWLGMLGIGIVGALGGFLSALLQVHRSRVTLAEYRSSKYTLQLRGLVGAVVAMLLFALLSWGVVPGVNITNAGTYFLVAFVAGFSERYFLRILNLGGDQQNAAEAEAAPSPGPLGRGA